MQKEIFFVGSTIKQDFNQPNFKPDRTTSFFGYFLDRIFSIRSAAYECRIFDIRSALLRMSDFGHSISSPSNVEYSTSEAPFFGCRIFDIRLAVRRMSNIRHPNRLNSDIEHSMSAGCSLQLLTRHQTIYIHCIIVF